MWLTKSSGDHRQEQRHRLFTYHRYLKILKRGTELAKASPDNAQCEPLGHDRTKEKSNHPPSRNKPPKLMKENSLMGVMSFMSNLNSRYLAGPTQLVFTKPCNNQNSSLLAGSKT